MKDTGYINIQGWMINKLKLKGNELILFGLIFGFSQDGESKFRGSISYIEKALSVSRKTAISIATKLVEKNYILKEKNTTGSLYSVNTTLVEKLHQGSVESTLVTSVETTPNNNKPNNNITIPDCINKKVWESWVAYRKEIKKTLKPTTMESQLSFLEKNKQDHVEIINKSIQNGWTGLFEIKKFEKTKRVQYDTRTTDYRSQAEKDEVRKKEQVMLKDSAQSNPRLAEILRKKKEVSISNTVQAI
ncbi:MAG: helix-turn-helix domain-containing protein [Candidatus Peribacteraceae bacterium]|nr:helix-turn-helix domain-containing protein [Candidatus Peribacteraceae bacterium]